MRRVARRVATGLLLLVSSNCGDDRTAEDTGFGSAQIGVSIDAVSAADVARVTLTITGANITPAIVHDLASTDGVWRGVIDRIPAGTGRTFRADAYDAADVGIFAGDVADVTISVGATTAVVILLQQVTPPDPFSNDVPVISGVVASSNAVAPGQTVSLRAVATDPDGDTLAYAWTGTGGTFSDASAATTSWTAPAESGTQTLTITVSDGRGGSRAVSVTIDVQSYHGRGAASVSVEVNTWPDITSVTADPGRADVASVIALAVTATDGDGDPLSYLWSDGGCGGSFSDAAVVSPTYTTPASAPAGGTCSLTVQVSDGRGGSNSGSVVVQVGPPVSSNTAPAINHTFQSSTTAAPGGTVELRVAATDPEGGAVSFGWTASGGTLDAPTTTASDSRVIWTAPATAGSYTVTVTITDAEGAATTHAFDISI